MKFNLTPEQARAEWVKALRSGEYRQTTGDLCNTDRDHDGPTVQAEIGYCCLGVACDVFMKREPQFTAQWEIVANDDGKDHGVRSFVLPGTLDNPEHSILPEVVREWLGLARHDGQYDVNIVCPIGTPAEDCEGYNTLTEMNDDSGADFNDIADLIENPPKGFLT